MLNKVFFILFAVLLISVQSQTIISSCAGLQNIANNFTDSYVLNQTIDCSTTTFTPLGNANTPFTGVLNGLGNKIFNLTINSANTLVGIFATANGSRFTNITFQDVTVIADAGTSVSALGVIVAQAINVQFDNIVFNTQNLAQNFINATYGSNVDSVGALAGSLDAGSISQITIINTLVNAPAGNGVGGVVGNVAPNGTAVTATNVYNVGFSNGSLPIVNGRVNVGGLFGLFQKGTLSKSGVTAGVITNSEGVAGGVVGDIADTNVDQIYSRPTVTVNQPSGSIGAACGGLAGFYQFASAGTYTFSNSYSRAASVTCNNTVGGLVGNIANGSAAAFTANISNSYAAVSVNQQTGALIGNVTGFTGTPTITFSNVFFDNTTLTSAYGTGLNCAGLFNTVSAFNNATWGNDRLRIEYNFANGTCTCNGGCTAPTTAPTNAPTNAPTPKPSSGMRMTFSFVLAIILFFF